MDPSSFQGLLVILQPPSRPASQRTDFFLLGSIIDHHDPYFLNVKSAQFAFYSSSSFIQTFFARVIAFCYARVKPVTISQRSRYFSTSFIVNHLSTRHRMVRSLLCSGCPESDVNLETFYSAATGSVTQSREYCSAWTASSPSRFYGVLKPCISFFRRCPRYQLSSFILQRQLYNSKNEA